MCQSCMLQSLQLVLSPLMLTLSWVWFSSSVVLTFLSMFYFLLVGYLCIFLSTICMYCLQKLWWGSRGGGDGGPGLSSALFISPEILRERRHWQWPTGLRCGLSLESLASYLWVAEDLPVPAVLGWEGPEPPSFRLWFLPTIPSHLIAVSQEFLSISSWPVTLSLAFQSP